jgi:methionyl-tRNA formyltransferase
MAERARVPYLHLTAATAGELVPVSRAARPDLICVASLSSLLPPEVLDIPRHGAINLHPSALPRYRGPFPWFWQYFHCEKEIGFTVHLMEPSADTGPILVQEMVPVPLGTDVLDLMRRTEPIGARLMRAAADALDQGGAAPRPQPPGDYPTARVVRRDERLIDWEGWPIERVWHVMRGTYPWMDAVDYPGGTLTGARWSIGSIERRRTEDAPGRIGRDRRGWYVGHREGRIRIRPGISWRRRLRNILAGYRGG